MDASSSSNKVFDLSDRKNCRQTFLMPKKRFTSQYSKPPSSVHPSLSSTANAGNSSANKSDASPSVNELINSSRKTAKSSGLPVASPTPTLPPQIRHLLAQPETPAPNPRSRPRRRVDANGRPFPAGPPPPRSWLERSRHAPGWMKNRGDERAFPTDICHLPGLEKSNNTSLQAMCMRQMAKHWEYVQEWEQNNLAELPTRLRMQLLSHIAVGGPDEGVGFEGLRSIIVPPGSAMNNSSPGEVPATETLHASTSSITRRTSNAGKESAIDNWDAESPHSILDSDDRNDGFFYLDLSGSIGYSISFKQLNTLLEKPAPLLSAPIPHLTHLSLSHPLSTISWRGLLAIAKHMPTLTHLSLASWPTPTLTPNSRAAVMSSQYGKDVQYGGTSFYSHTLDDDFREAADVLRRLASRLYGLEYLDLTGCSGWIRALRWTGIGADSPTPGNITPPHRISSSPPSSRHIVVEGIDWRISWLKLSTLKLNSNITLTENSHNIAISSFAKGVREARALQKILFWWMKNGGRGKKGVWVDVGHEDSQSCNDLWRGNTEAERKNRGLLELLSETEGVDLEIELLNELLNQDDGHVDGRGSNRGDG